jgi:hypothetical protein
MIGWRTRLAIAITLFMAALLAFAQEVSSGILVHALESPNPVLGMDERIHLAYELQVVNLSSALITIDDVEALDSSGTKLDELNGDALGKRVRISGGESGRTFGPSHSGYIFMDVSLPGSSHAPISIKHRITITRQLRAAPGDDHHGAPLPADLGVEASISFIGAEISVGQTPAITIAPPVRGPGWIVANGCCDQPNAHRGTVLAINGTARVFERFAIDFAQLNAANRLFDGDIKNLSSYAYFGTSIYSVADGTVVEVRDNSPEETPGTAPRGQTAATALGNYVIADLRTGHFALYAHLQKGSVAVKAGDRIRLGEVIGRVGNSGNTDAPHLHFQIMDRPSASSNSLPFVFANFASTGVVTRLDLVFRGEPATVNSKMAGPHPNRFPLNNHVMSFDP